MSNLGWSRAVGYAFSYMCEMTALFEVVETLRGATKAQKRKFTKEVLREALEIARAKADEINSQNGFDPAPGLQ